MRSHVFGKQHMRTHDVQNPNWAIQLWLALAGPGSTKGYQVTMDSGKPWPGSVSANPHWTMHHVSPK